MSTWTVIDNDRGNEQQAESRQKAEEMAATAREFGSEDVDIVPPGDDTEEKSTTPEVVAEHAGPVDHDAEYQLEDRSVAEDPLDWVPGEFVDEIDGSLAINRKGYEVLSHFYNVDVAAEILVAPEETDHEYCRIRATAITEDGRECMAHGSSHVDRGDDHYLLVEMADTRARKRALSIATGVGAVAVDELRNEMEQ